jgi:hypothetical protein
MVFGRKIREVPPLNSIDNIVLKCVSPTKHPRQSGFVPRKTTKSANYSGLERQNHESPMHWPA